MGKPYLTRRDVAKSIGLAGVTGLAGCIGGTSSGSSGGTKVAMIYTVAGKGDNGFNDSAFEGVKRAREELGVEVNEATPSGPDQYSTLMQKYAQQDYDLIQSIGFDTATPMKQVANDNPDTQFSIVDTPLEGIENISSYVFKEQEGCYLAGSFAGALTQDPSFDAGSGAMNEANVVGFLGGKRIPTIERFHAGFKAGLDSFEADVELRAAYAGTWSAPQKGKSIAESMYNNGADVVFPAAGNTGTGALKAAQEQERYALGVDKPQSEVLPKYADVILGSMVKRVGEAVFRSIESVTEDDFAPSVHSLGLAKGGVELNFGAELGDAIPSNLKSELEATKDQIVSGDIDVPSTLEN